MPDVLQFTDLLDNDKPVFDESNKVADGMVWVGFGPVAIRMRVGEVLAWKLRVLSSSVEQRGGEFISKQLCEKLSYAITEIKRVDSHLAEMWAKEWKHA